MTAAAAPFTHTGSDVSNAAPASAQVHVGERGWGLCSWAAMSCTIEKILTDAKTLLERLREHDAAAESLVDQSAALHRRVAAMREAGTALPDQVGRRVGGRAGRFCASEGCGEGRRKVGSRPERSACSQRVAVRPFCGVGAGNAALEPRLLLLRLHPRLFC